MTQVLGIVGGIGPESTIAYYRAIVAKFRDRGTSSGYPRIIINSIDASAMLALMPAGRYEELATMLAREVDALVTPLAAPRSIRCLQTHGWN